MYMKSIDVFTGFSESGIDDALQNALNNAGNPIDFEVIETVGSRDNMANRQYQVILKKKLTK
jgi:flavin-binding protein dodecin